MAVKSKQTRNANGEELKWPFGKKNYILFAVAMVVIAIGFVLLGQNSIVMAPILLVVGYCVLIPLSIIVRDNGVTEETSADSAK